MIYDRMDEAVLAPGWLNTSKHKAAATHISMAAGVLAIFGLSEKGCVQ